VFCGEREALYTTFEMHPQFPNFRKLTLDDREAYSELIAEYTPFSDISFTTLHVWWNLDDKLFFSVLNGNLVLNYSQPFDKASAGLSVIGHHKVNQTVEELFDYLKQNNRAPKLVHVPEFVVEELTNRDGLDISEEHDMNEYIMDAVALASLETRELGRIRRKVNRFLREVEDRELEIKQLDLGHLDNRDLIYNSVLAWQRKYPNANDPKATENRALESSLRHHEALGIENLCVFVDGNLQAVVLYHQTHDKKYFVLNHLKVDYELPFIFDFTTNEIAKLAAKHSVPYLNMEMDLGIEGLRNHKMGLRPVHFLRKFTIRPT
jgi:uncharacterized protein